jgi:putative DNA methylase
MTYDRRLIEDSLPLEIISEQSAREKSIRHGHISTLHIWWARRPLAAMRAAIFASLIPAPKDEKEREYLHKLIGDIVNWDSVNHGNNARIEEARALIRKHYPDAPPKILDPFMGGGSTGLETLRLGAEAHGVELNPVAYLIQLCTLVYPQKYGQPKTVYAEPELEQAEFPGMEAPKQAEQLSLGMEHGDPLVIQNPLAADVRKWGMWVLEEARKEIGHLYEDHEGRTIVGYLWARTAKCPNPMCGAEIPLVRQWWLSKTGKRKIATRMIVNKTAKKYTFEIAEGSDIDFDPENGTMRQGSTMCPVCGQIPPEDYLRQQGIAGNLGALPMVAIYENSGKSGKGFRPISETDIAVFETAEEEYRQLVAQNPDAVPDEPVSREQPRIIWVILYGLDQWFKLFNARQLLSIMTFNKHLQYVRDAVIKQTGDPDYATAVTTYLALIVDRLASSNSTLCRWQANGEFVVNTFGQQALPMMWDYTEINPFSGFSGDWLGSLDWVIRVIEHCANASNQFAILNRTSATRLPYLTEFDAVITDPPYYDAVPYSDLSDYFYVWLKRSVGELYPELFVTPLTPKALEIVEQRPHQSLKTRKDAAFYESNLTKAFEEAHRVLKEKGVFTVVFAHKSTAAWETLINSLLQAGLVVTASWPLRTERPGRLISQDKAALASSIFIVCRKRQAQDDGFFDDVRREMTSRIKERLDFFWSEGIRGADFFISAIGPAVEVFGRYKAVRKLSGDIVSVADLLDLVQEAVADYTLSRVLNGRYKMGTVDAPTRFYVMYRWSYGNEKLLFDDARRLAQALGAEVNDLVHRDSILKQSGDSVTMPSATERKKDEHLGEAGRDGNAPSVIDVLHRAVLVWQNADRRALAEYLAQHALGREEEVNAVAQALINVLPQGDRERQLLENYLQGSTDLPDVPRQNRLL